MNPAQLHLMVNHLPVIGTPVVAALLLWGLLRGSRELRRTALGATVIVAVLSYPVFLTGEPAEETVEDEGWLHERLVHEHEERAEAGLIAILATGALGTVVLWQSRGGREVPTVSSGLTFAGLVVSSTLFGWSALAGGAIRHDELRPAALGGPLDSAQSRISNEGSHGDRDN
jgi:hypothetical protein